MTLADGRDGLNAYSASGPQLPRVVVAVCTYRRNEPLRHLLEALVEAAHEARQLCTVGAVVVDDCADREAEPVVRAFEGKLALGVYYRVSGHQNISRARNVALEAAMIHGDWVAMTDDDCVPDRRWLAELVEGQRRTGADAVSGRLVRRAPVDSPRWIVDQPFLSQGVACYDSDTELAHASTHNSLISVEWLRAHPAHRFDPDLGRVGGEDMVFFKTAHVLGLRITYSAEAVVFEDQPAERLSFGFFVWQALWLGNSSFVTSTQGGQATRWRMVVHGVATLGRAVSHPVRRLLKRKPPQLRFSIAMCAGGVGILLGTCGLRVRHH
jgi:succinoglycan biosynthesis protein ExoM